MFGGTCSDLNSCGNKYNINRVVVPYLLMQMSCINSLIIYILFPLQYAMEPNYLHIWPRDTFMMIALPNTVV